MKPHIRERAIKIGEHIIKTGDTLRETGAKFYIDRSTVRQAYSNLKKLIHPCMKRSRQLWSNINLKHHLRVQ